MDEPKPADLENEVNRKTKRLEEARRVVEEYANNLRKALDTLREKLN